MGTELRNVPNIDREILQKRGKYLRHTEGADIVISTVNPQYRRFENLAEANLQAMYSQLVLSRDEARALAMELILFAEGQEVEGRFE
tara:strand:+ start:321 stop:581 length:261 start_codon:yes stop_codon:yes gene_type:complete